MPKNKPAPIKGTMKPNKPKATQSKMGVRPAAVKNFLKKYSAGM